MSESSIGAFRDVISEPENTFVENARSSGKKVVGFFCSYIPLELLDAVGVLAYRVKGLSGRDIGSGTTYLSSRICTFCRNALTLALEGDFSFLDGLIGTNTCDPVRRTSQNWVIKKPPEFNEFIHAPRVYRRENVSMYAAELDRLKTGLEGWLGTSVSEDSLAEAIAKRNAARGLLRRLSELRSSNKHALTGAEMMAVSVAYHQMPVDDFLAAAERLLADREALKGEPGKARVLLAGGMIDDPGYVELIEEQGLDVVADTVCFGYRSYRDDVAEGEEPLRAIAERYMLHFPCSRIGDAFPRRWDETLELYDGSGAEGIIFQRLKFCQLWGVDVHNMTPLCEERGIPLLYLEREYGFLSTGQLKTRLQAFKELIESKKEMMA
jgi:benzoyl-CoA reductase/2-hydroxyglutaryl-CoA dehydratase subunit BcrC/BadD/HgdB